MSDDLLALLHGCKDNPDDNAPRLVLADWLEEHGEPERAEFIRLQCRGNDQGTPGAVERARREEELLNANGERWLSGLCRGLWLGWGQRPPSVRVSRGLIQLRNDRGFHNLAMAVLPEDAAWVESLSCVYESHDGKPRLKEIAASPLFSEVATLSLTAADINEGGPGGTYVENLGADDVRALLDAGPMPRLRRLHLVKHQFTPQ